MHISIIAIGRMQRGPEYELVHQYLNRLPWKYDVVEIELKKQAAQAKERKLREAERLSAAIPNGAAVIVLDENGRALKSRELAGKIDNWQSIGISNLAFIIGGADGLDKDFIAKADLKLAFGSLTWPHMMVRAMIAEQIYRVWSINAGHPYHRD
ncbi:23S rRNA (pseudouridine(1915)-N(3))-methyltransferase RlmH [Kordiimonas aquimaris]|uniref:23S rRNA (pseudouridine(1915)-N(3))-methyltransferase RlmH n=1 Tax=Kordiimonas aquimaris TaxID=707591 RepID=UPI0021CF0F9A|nr:23S rRNA (pseudouridine(1915)-N(3))-methyltransferase RlmH [Kordiimonas aquimaris]